MSQRDYYELLGVGADASAEELRMAYRRLAQQCHPDVAGRTKEQENMFVLINEAYRVLSDPQRRNEYNKETGRAFHEEISISGPLGTPGEVREPVRKVDLSGGALDPSRLRNLAGDADLKVGHKVALAGEQPVEDDPDIISAWGEDEETERPADTGGFGGLLRSFKKKASTQRRAELKSRLREQLDQQMHPKQPAMPKKKPTRPQSAPVDRHRDSSTSNPLAGERIFRFQISALEAALGTSREIVLASHGGDVPLRLPVDIPAGIRDGSMMEVSQGWERAKIRITVVQDPLFQVLGADIHMRIPITLSEAVMGAEFQVPVVNNARAVSIIPGRFEGGIRLEGAGVPTEDGRGSMTIYPFVVPPQQVTPTLREAAKIVDQHCAGDCREEYLADPLSSRFFRVDEGMATIFIPVTFRESLEGLTLQLSTPAGLTSFTLPSPWNPQQQLTLPDPFEEDGVSLPVHVVPVIQVPIRQSEILSAALVAIDQHYLGSVRRHLPRKLTDIR